MIRMLSLDFTRLRRIKMKLSIIIIIAILLAAVADKIVSNTSDALLMNHRKNLRHPPASVRFLPGWDSVAPVE